MATTLDTINTILNDRRRDTTNNTVDMTAAGFRAINSALQMWNNTHDWPWQVRDVNFDYNEGITQYPLSGSIASDFKYDISLRPFRSRNEFREFNKVSPYKFPSDMVHARRYAIDTNELGQYLFVKHTGGTSASLHAAGDFDGDGTWVGAGAISNVATDSYESFDLSSSISFDYSGTSGTLTNSDMSARDLSQFVDRSNLYLNLYLPTITDFTSVTLKWGSSASDHYSVTATTDYLENTVAVGWNKFKFAWSSPTVVGTPDAENVDYVQVTIAYASDPAATGFRLENIFVSENVPLTLTYYSVNMVYDESGSVQLQQFNDSSATADYPLWSGRWDSATEPFINTALELIFWISSEQTDQAVATQKAQAIINEYKTRYPSRRRFMEVQLTPDINYR